jgi:O-antigen/teichoic acid export membrane protein
MSGGELTPRIGRDVVIGRGTLSAIRSLLWTRSTLWLVGNSLAALMSRAIYAAEQWGVVLLIARAATPATVGIYGLASAIVTPVFGLFSLDLRSLLATDYHGRHRTTEYVAVRLATALLAMLCALAGAILLGYSSTLLVVVLLVALRKFFEGLSDILFAVMQKHERMDLPARSAIVKTLASVAVVGFVLTNTHSLPLALGGLVLVSLAILLIYDARLVMRVEPNWFRLADVGKENGLVRQAVPLGLVAALIALQTSLPRYFLAAQHGDTMVGHLTVLSHFLIAGTIVNGAFQQSAGPRLARYFTTRRPDRFVWAVAALCGASAALGVAGVAIVVLLGPAILAFVYGPEYVEFADALPWLMAAGIASYMLASVSTALTVMRRLTMQVVAATCSAIVCLVTSWMFVPTWGPKGAAWAILAASVANLLITGFAFVREMHSARRPSGLKSKPSLAGSGPE